MKKILILLIIILDIFLFTNSKIIVNEFNKTINICLYTLMPSMFFQILFSNILIKSSIEKYMPNRICRIFNINKNELAIILLSMFSGYPNNIKLLKESKNEYLNYVTNYINPSFLLTTVGFIYLKNIKISLIIFISIITSNLFLTFLLKNKYVNDKYNKKDYKNIYSSSLIDTIKTLSIIFSNLLFISILVVLLKILLPFNNNINSFILGLLEFSKGIYEISNLNIKIFNKGLLILIISVFASISIHFQMISINPKIKYIKYLKYRIFNIFISVIVYIILFILIYKI